MMNPEYGLRPVADVVPLPDEPRWIKDGRKGKYSQRYARHCAEREVCRSKPNLAKEANIAAGLNKPIRPDLPPEVIRRKIRNGSLSVGMR